MGEVRGRSAKRGLNEPSAALNDSPASLLGPRTIDYQAVLESVYTESALRDALKTDVAIMRSRKEPGMTRLAASDRIKDRTLGKVADKLHLSGGVKLTCADVYVHPAEDRSE